MASRSQRIPSAPAERAAQGTFAGLLIVALLTGCGGTGHADGAAGVDAREDAASRTGASLAVSPNPVAARSSMHITGCGYSPSLSVSGEDSGPAGTRTWGAIPDAAGCIALDLSAGSDAGAHTLRTYQQLKRGRATLIAQASFTVVAAPLAVYSERYFWRWDATKNCVSEDDTLDWSGSGYLAPGESFTFTPKYPDCNDPRAVMVTLTADAGATLQISTVVPASDRYSSDASQAGKTIVVTTSGGVANLCMFPDTSMQPAAGYTITVKNLGTTTASNVQLTGKDYNDWPVFFWNTCAAADADHDGWSDSLEHEMAQLVASATEFTGKGSNYLSSCGTPQANDEFDFWPPDLDDDGAITQADVDLLAPHLGEGNGIPWANISPNSGIPEAFWSHVGAWNRYDLNGDGWVDSQDLQLVKGLVGARCGP